MFWKILNTIPLRGSGDFATYLANVAEISKDPTLIKRNLYNQKGSPGAGA